jgi:hypothetical protein
MMTNPQDPYAKLNVQVPDDLSMAHWLVEEDAH